VEATIVKFYSVLNKTEVHLQIFSVLTAAIR